MRNIPALIIGFSLLLPGHLLAMCCPLPCVDCDIVSSAQLNIVRIDRDSGTVDLIPNIIVRGMAADFALVLPSPSEPQFSEVDRSIWAEVRTLSSSVFTRTNSSGCSNDGIFLAGSETTGQGRADDVDVHREETVGSFIATVLTSNDANALVQWLQDNDYNVSSEDAASFAPYIARGWFFTAMKLDLTDPANEMPPVGWNNEVNPIRVTYEADIFEVPLPITSINRSSFMPMVFYVIDRSKKDLPGFALQYANDLSPSELAAIRRQYPVFGALVRQGDFITKVRKNFTLQDPMEESLILVNAADNDEFRLGASRGMLPLSVALLLLALVPTRIVLRRRTP